MKMDLSNYKAAHGTNPRGNGHWLATIIRSDGAMTEIAASGKWSDARKSIERQAKDIGGTIRIVLQS